MRERELAEADTAIGEAEAEVVDRLVVRQAVAALLVVAHKQVGAVVAEVEAAARDAGVEEQVVVLRPAPAAVRNALALAVAQVRVGLHRARFELAGELLGEVL